MNYEKFKYSGWLMALALIQVATLLIYLNANIVNVGGMGTALPVLMAYVGLSSILFGLIWLQKSLYVRSHFFLFLLLIAWIAVRVVVDLGDMDYLKQITLATTGGMLLFYLMGTFLSVSYQSLLMPRVDSWLTKLVSFIFLMLLLWMVYQFSQRMHPRLFYLTGVDGVYQRSGNFLSISFIVVSFFYLLHSLKRIRNDSGRPSGLFWLAIYTASAFISLAGSQLFGSNSATAVILGVYLITFVMALLAPRKGLWVNYLKNNLTLPWSKKLLIRLTLIAVLGLLFFLVFLVFMIVLTGFDITSIRLLGFGSGSNSSLFSRIEILMMHGASQIGYEPFFGNINVAYLTTGNAGRTLHSFFPYVLANLGVVGLSVVLALFASVIFQLYGETKTKQYGSYLCYQKNMVALYSFFVLLFLILFANFATGVSWAVLWFTLGFISKPFGFKLNEKNSKHST